MSLRVLVVDDSRTMRKIVCRILDSVGVQDPTEAYDGNNALEIFQSQEFDLVITDWNMPGMTGLEVLQAIRSKGFDVPIVMLTTEADRRQVMAAVESGATDYLLKPLDQKNEGKLKKICQLIRLEVFRNKLRPTMKMQYITPFVTSTMKTLKSMLNCAAEQGTPFMKETTQPQFDVAGVASLSGIVEGTVVLSLSRKAAIEAVNATMAEPPKDANPYVADVIGELTNIIVGNAQQELDHFKLKVGLPTVLIGRSQCVEFPANVLPLCVPLETDWGPISLEVGYTERVEAAAGQSS